MKQRYIILGSGNKSISIKWGAEISAIAADQLNMPVSLEDLDDAEAQNLQRDPDVLSVTPAEVPLSLITPMDEEPGELATTVWGLDAVGALLSPRTGKGVRVAVLDTGLKLDHEAFSELRTQGRIATRNFTSDDPNDISDTNGHGTHCAGTVAGGPVAGQRISVAPGIERLIIGKVLGLGGGSNETIVKAIQWAAGERANIISMSLGIDFPGLVKRLNVQNNIPLQAATSMALKQYRDTVILFSKLADFLSAQDILLIAASGNESHRPTYTIDVAPPAASEYILKVGAVGKPSGEMLPVARFSNTGPDVVGPGIDILSANIQGGLRSLSGTSMATPHVAGVAALWAEHLLAKNGVISFQDIKAEILTSARQFDGQRNDVGRGLITAPKA